MIKKKLLSFGLAVALVFVFTGCDDGKDTTVPVTGVTLTGDANFSLAVGQSRSLDFTVLPADATDKAVRWSSSDTTAAIVSSEGIVYAIGKGTATVTVTTRDGSKTDTRTVTVTEGIPATGLELDKTSLFLVKGSTGLLTPTVYPANATDTTVTWLSNNPTVASVNNGTVSGVAAGTAVITAAIGIYELTCNVTVVNTAPEAPGMVWINPGTFIMGSPYDEPESYDNELPHKVTLTEGFYMGEHTVTQKQFLDVMGYNDSYFPDEWDSYYPDRWEDCPVETVMWYEAIIFCNLLSIEEDLSPAYTMYRADAPGADSYYLEDEWVDIPDNWSTDPGDWFPFSWVVGNHVRLVPGSSGYRLPTEAQWEYACRAGTTTAFNTGNNIAYPVLDEDDEIVDGEANYYGYYPYNYGGEFYPDGFAFYKPIPVGQFDKNAWDLYDMHGNVREWCWDWYGSYSRPSMTESVDPAGPATGGLRVARGGSFWSDGYELRSAYRTAENPANFYDNTVGFRLVRPYSEPSVSSSKAVRVNRSGIGKMMQAAKNALQGTRNFNRTDRSSASPVRLEASLREAALRREAVIVE